MGKYNSGKSLFLTEFCLNYDNNDDGAAGSVLWLGVLEEEKKMSALLSLWFQRFTSLHHR